MNINRYDARNLVPATSADAVVLEAVDVSVNAAPQSRLGSAVVWVQSTLPRLGKPTESLTAQVAGITKGRHPEGHDASLANEIRRSRDRHCERNDVASDFSSHPSVIPKQAILGISRPAIATVVVAPSGREFVPSAFMKKTLDVARYVHDAERSVEEVSINGLSARALSNSRESPVRTTAL